MRLSKEEVSTLKWPYSSYHLRQSHTYLVAVWMVVAKEGDIDLLVVSDCLAVKDISRLRVEFLKSLVKKS